MLHILANTGFLERGFVYLVQNQRATWVSTLSSTSSLRAFSWIFYGREKDWMLSLGKTMRKLLSVFQPQMAQFLLLKLIELKLLIALRAQIEPGAPKHTDFVTHALFLACIFANRLTWFRYHCAIATGAVSVKMTAWSVDAYLCIHQRTRSFQYFVGNEYRLGFRRPSRYSPSRCFDSWAHSWY